MLNPQRDRLGARLAPCWSIALQCFPLFAFNVPEGPAKVQRTNLNLQPDGNINFAVEHLKILHIIVSFSPAHGGPPEAVRQLVRAYQKIGANIEVVCLDKPDAPFLKNIQCPVHAIGEGYLGKYALSPRLLRWLRKNAHRFDGIVMNGIWTFPGVATWIAARRAGTPYGIFVHGALDPWFNKTYPLKHLKKLIYWPVQRAVLHDAHAVFFTTQAERDLAIQSFPSSKWKSVVVPYGIVDPEEDSPDHDAQAEAFFSLMPQLRGKRYLLFLARIHEKKGCDLLIQAFAKLAASAPDVDLVIAGPDQAGLQHKLQRMAADLGIAPRVHWPGFLGGDRKWGALRACDAFVLPSHQENFGIAVVEALAAGRPVLISNQVNIWEEIETDRVGIVAEDTLQGTERILRQWLSLPEEQRSEMASHARPCFLQRYAMNRAAVAINKVFQKARGIGQAASIS